MCVFIFFQPLEQYIILWMTSNHQDLFRDRIQRKWSAIQNLESQKLLKLRIHTARA